MEIPTSKQEKKDHSSSQSPPTSSTPLALLRRATEEGGGRKVFFLQAATPPPHPCSLSFLRPRLLTPCLCVWGYLPPPPSNDTIPFPIGRPSTMIRLLSAAGDQYLVVSIFPCIHRSISKSRVHQCAFAKAWGLPKCAVGRAAFGPREQQGRGGGSGGGHIV